MPNKPPDVAVRFAPGFKRDLKALSKKYRHILSDLSSVLDQLQTGHLPGDKIAGAGFTVYKVRVKNSDIKRGKSSGYRLIYFLKSSKEIILVTIYSKLDMAGIKVKRIREILKNLNK